MEVNILRKHFFPKAIICRKFLIDIINFPGRNVYNLRRNLVIISTDTFLLAVKILHRNRT